MEELSKRLIDMTDEELIAKIVKAVDRLCPIEPPRFIAEAEAKKLLNCGKTTLYTLRVNSKISFVQDEEHRKMILYDRISIMKYLEKNLKKAF